MGSRSSGLDSASERKATYDTPEKSTRPNVAYEKNLYTQGTTTSTKAKNSSWAVDLPNHGTMDDHALALSEHQGIRGHGHGHELSGGRELSDETWGLDLPDDLISGADFSPSPVHSPLESWDFDPTLFEGTLESFSSAIEIGSQGVDAAWERGGVPLLNESGARTMRGLVRGVDAPVEVKGGGVCGGIAAMEKAVAPLGTARFGEVRVTRASVEVALLSYCLASE